MTEDIQEQSLDEPLLSQEMPPCPGRRLHEARVGKGLSVEEVATQLCLKVELINALEQDDYDKLPPPTFVGGYLRNYARLLGLPENDIIESYTRCVGEQSPSLIAATSLKTEAKASDLPIRIVTYLLVIGLGVMLFVWWMAQREEMRALLPEVVTSIEPGMNVVAEDDPISEQNLKQSHEQDIKTAVTTVIIDNTKTDVSLEEIESVLPELPLDEVVEPSIPPLPPLTA
ncbi:MAG: helix-turn-helix domain-containing protein, partial [Gammaproteobacteria bacterium]|nr:helix-turn-helix domain-containing protein [Gammaproteobacteria bacterium]